MMRNLCLLVVLLAPAWVWGQYEMVTGHATPQEVVQKVAEAARFLSQQGEKGLKEFEDPRGRFVWKDTFVWVTECAKNYCLPTPRTRDLGLNLSQMKCAKTGKLYILSLCDDMDQHPNGSWVEHWQSKPGSAEPERKVTFMRQVPGTPYQVVAGTFDDHTSLAQLQRLVK
jgi:cytochrome c